MLDINSLIVVNVRGELNTSDLLVGSMSMNTRGVSITDTDLIESNTLHDNENIENSNVIDNTELDPFK